MNYLKCSVCHSLLAKNDNTYKCINNHSYDISSKGYINLLLANQHHSLNPGDSKEMILSRVRFLSLDYYHVLRAKLTEIISSLDINEDIRFCDLACGEGYYTNYIHEKLSESKNVFTVGIDLSKQGIIECSKKVRASKLNNIDYVIGNLERMPFMDESFNVMLNCFAPIFEDEFNRVVKKNGYYIRVLPDADHLLGIKEVLYKEVKLNVMKEKTLDGFSLVNEYHVKDEITLKSSQEIHDLFTMTPYYYKTSIEASNRLLSKDSLKTIISFVILVYKKGE